MKRKQPETSLVANQNKSIESKERDYAEILRAFKSIGSGTYEDVSKFLGWKDLNKSARRFKEMRERNLLTNTGLKKMTTRNRPAFIHKLCESSHPAENLQNFLDTLLTDRSEIKTQTVQQQLFP